MSELHFYMKGIIMYVIVTNLPKWCFKPRDGRGNCWHQKCYHSVSIVSMKHGKVLEDITQRWISEQTSYLTKESKTLEVFPGVEALYLHRQQNPLLTKVNCCFLVFTWEHHTGCLTLHHFQTQKPYYLEYNSSIDSN